MCEDRAPGLEGPARLESEERLRCIGGLDAAGAKPMQLLRPMRFVFQRKQQSRPPRAAALEPPVYFID
jgi:hypothetical protein